MVVMQKVLNHENCVMLMTFFPIFVILILFWFFFLFVANTDWLSLSERRDNSWDLILSFWKSLRGLPQSVCFVWFSHLTILEWRQWNRLTFNQSIEILTLAFSRFFLNFDYYAQQENTRLWDRSCAPLKDGNGLSHFGMWLSENFPI